MLEIDSVTPRLLAAAECLADPTATLGRLRLARLALGAAALESGVSVGGVELPIAVHRAVSAYARDGETVRRHLNAERIARLRADMLEDTLLRRLRDPRAGLAPVAIGIGLADLYGPNRYPQVLPIDWGEAAIRAMTAGGEAVAALQLRSARARAMEFAGDVDRAVDERLAEAAGCRDFGLLRGERDALEHARIDAVSLGRTFIRRALEICARRVEIAREGAEQHAALADLRSALDEWNGEM